MVARGNILKVIGAEDQIILFQKKFKAFISHIDQYNRLTFSEIERLILEDETKILENKTDLILHGSDGRWIKARNVNQRRLVNEIMENDIVFAFLS